MHLLLSTTVLNLDSTIRRLGGELGGNSRQSLRCPVDCCELFIHSRTVTVGRYYYRPLLEGRAREATVKKL